MKTVHFNTKNEDWLSEKNRKTLAKKRVEVARKKFDKATAKKVASRFESR